MQTSRTRSCAAKGHDPEKPQASRTTPSPAERLKAALAERARALGFEALRVTRPDAVPEIADRLLRIHADYDGALRTVRRGSEAATARYKIAMRTVADVLKG